MEEKETKTKKTTVKKTSTTKKPATKKTTTKKDEGKSSPKKTSAAKKATTKKAATTKKPDNKSATKKTTEKKETVKKASAKKETAKTSAKKETAKTEVLKDDVKTIEPEIVAEPIIDETTFCGKCGRKLKNGEVCNCSTVNDPIINIDKEAIKEKSKGILDTIFNVYKAPYDTCKKEVESNEIRNSIIILALFALSLGFLISALTYASFHLNIGELGSVSDYYKVPYFKIFIVWSVILFIISFLPIVLSHLAGVLFSKDKFSFTGLVNLYAYSFSVVIFINVISAIFIFGGLFVKFFLLVSLLALLLGTINYIFIYRDLMNFEKSKEAYIFLGIVLVWILGLVVISSLFASGVDGLNAFDTIISTMNQ